jgi:hypothetical protein
MPHALLQQAATPACAPPIALCVRCGLRPRWCGGAISRCRECIRSTVDAEHAERRERAARSQPTADTAEATKVCRCCRALKPMSAYAGRRSSRIGETRSCRLGISGPRLLKSRSLEANMHTTVILELGPERLTVSVARPAEFASYEAFAAGTYSWVLQVRNYRGFRHDDLDQLAQLGERRAFVQAALTSHPACAWIGDDDASTPWRTRQAISDATWLKILHAGGARAVARICDAFLDLWPESS